MAELGDDHDLVGRVVTAVRQSAGFAPVLLLHRRSTPLAGRTHTYADAHLVEPYSLEQLRVELDLLLNPTVSDDQRILRIADVELNPTSHEVAHRGRPIQLSRLEFDLLGFLLRNHGTVLSRTRILDHVWPQPVERTGNIVDVCIAQLRKKMNHVEAPIIQTVRGVGFLVKSPERRVA